MSKEKTLGVALVKEACPLCGKLQDGPIIMNKILSETRAQEVENLHGKTIGYMEKACQECQDHMKLGIKLVVIDGKKSEPGNVWRTGHQYVVTEDFINKVFADSVREDILSKRASFIPIEVEEALKLNTALSEEE